MLSLVYSYYDNPEMLELHIKTWMGYSDEVKAKMNFVIVDDCSPKFHAEPIVRELLANGVDQAHKLSPAKFQLFRIEKDIPWNLDGARNLAMKEGCLAGWALITDMDRLLSKENAEATINLVKERGKYYRPMQVWWDGVSLNRPHPNSFIIHRDDYWLTGGYDEDFAGSYGSDGNFRKNLKPHCEEVYVESPHLICCEDGVPDSITKGLPRKENGSYCLTIPRLKEKVKSPPYVAVNPIRFPWVRVL